MAYFFGLTLSESRLQPAGAAPDQGTDLGNSRDLVISSTVAFGAVAENGWRAGERAVWFRWTAPEAGVLFAQASLSQFSLYSNLGGELIPLSPIALLVEGGREIYLCGSERGNHFGTFQLKLELKRLHAFDVWRQRIMTPELGGPNHDPDEDLIPNLLEMVFELNPYIPLVNDRGPRGRRANYPSVTLSHEGERRLEFEISEQVLQGVGVVTVDLEISPDLGTREVTRLVPGVAYSIPLGGDFSENHYRSRATIRQVP